MQPDKWSVARSTNDVEEWDALNFVQCIENSINKLVFQYFGGEGCQWGFLIFLLGRWLKLSRSSNSIVGEANLGPATTKHS
jgi:hypothetical protein